MGDLTVRAKTVLNILGIETVDQLLTTDLPEIGTVLRNSFFGGYLTYSKKVDEELKQVKNIN